MTDPAFAAESHSRTCQACKSAAATRTVETSFGGAPYRLCAPCESRLRSHSLRPREWLNLAAIHSSSEYYLHDDFYDRNGRASQPGVAVEEPGEPAVPAVDDVAENLEALLDLAFADWWLSREAADALARFDPADLLAGLGARLARHCNAAIEDRAYEICGKVLGPAAADWVRERWREHGRADIGMFPVAAAACLPGEEGIELVIAALDVVPAADLADRARSSLGEFRSARVLDWIEVHGQSPVEGAWGALAAVSRFSWPRAERWLDAGRPLSLIALDALADCQPRAQAAWPWLAEKAPRLLDPAPTDQMVARLRQYQEIDPVARVRQRVDSIVGQWESHALSDPDVTTR